jgi:hypothetical protein
LGKFWTALQWKVLVYFEHSSILRPFDMLPIWPFGIFCGKLAYFPLVGILYVARKIWQPIAATFFCFSADLGGKKYQLARISS